MYKKMSILGLLLLLLSACATETMHQETTSQTVERSEVATNPQQPMSSADMGLTGQEIDGQSIIHTANVQLQTVKYNEAKAAILNLIDESNVQIQYQDEYNYAGTEASSPGQTDDRLYTLTLTLRLPQDNFDSFISQLTALELTALEGISQGTQDVGTAVRDVTLRIESVEARIERLTDLLKDAQSIADIIEIQNSLDQAMIERDQLLAEQAQLDDQVQRATITVSLEEVFALGDGLTRQRSFWDELIKALQQTGQRFVDVLQQGVLGLVFILPYIFVLALLYVIYRILIKPLLKALGVHSLWGRKRVNQPEITPGAQEENEE